MTSITHNDVIAEKNNRKPPKKRFEVGDCFIYRDNVNELYLIKVTAEEHNNWFTCDEISINEHDIDYYDVSYHLDEYSDWEPLDPSIYDKVLALVNAREEAVSKIIEQFDKQIRDAIKKDK